MLCIICEKEIKTEFDLDPNNLNTIQPAYDALVCRSYGNFGSTLFDPQDNEFLQFILCDECAAKKANLIQKLNPNKKTIKSFSDQQPEITIKINKLFEYIDQKLPPTTDEQINARSYIQMYIMAHKPKGLVPKEKFLNNHPQTTHEDILNELETLSTIIPNNQQGFLFLEQ